MANAKGGEATKLDPKPALKIEPRKESDEEAMKRAKECYAQIDALLKEHGCRMQIDPLFDANGKFHHADLFVVPITVK